MASEGSLWDRTRENLSPFGRLKRIENRVDGGGMPDVLYCLKRKPFMASGTGWIELKECEWPKRRTKTAFLIPSLTIEQVEFAEDWVKVGGRYVLLCQVEKDYFIWEAKRVRPIFERQYSCQMASSTASVHWRLGSPWPLPQILDQLAGYENVNK